MKSHRFLLLLFIVFTGCCKDEVIESFKLNDFEKSLIVYTSFEDISFTDDQGDTFIANSEPKETKIDSYRLGPESCQIIEFELETSTLNFQSRNLLFKFSLRAFENTSFIIPVTNLETDDVSINLLLACENLDTLSLEDSFTNIIIGEFDFQDVLVFQECSETTGIERVIYSRAKGIEYIEFNNGKWLKLDD